MAAAVAPSISYRRRVCQIKWVKCVRADNGGKVGAKDGRREKEGGRGRELCKWRVPRIHTRFSAGESIPTGILFGAAPRGLALSHREYKRCIIVVHLNGYAEAHGYLCFYCTVLYFSWFFLIR